LQGFYVEGFPTIFFGSFSTGTLEKCQANNNSFIEEGYPTGTEIFGIDLTSANNVTIRECSTDRNKGSNGLAGIGVFVGFGDHAKSILVENCTASYNEGGGFSNGILFIDKDGSLNTDNLVVDCVTNLNVAFMPEDPVKAGIGVRIENVSNTKVLRCTASQNSTYGFVAGYVSSNVPDLGVFNSSFIECCATANGKDGFLLSGKIDRFILEKNISMGHTSTEESSGRGYVLEGILEDPDFTNIVIKDNEAVGNTVGFEQKISPIKTGYFGNLAQRNTTNYDVADPIQLYTYDDTAGSYTLADGVGSADTPNRWSNIQV